MVHQFVRNAITAGRTFADEAALRKYLNRIIPRVVKKGTKERTAKMHAGHVLYLYRNGKLNGVLPAAS